MLIGKVISHYRVLEKIGQGGMGEVFLAEDTILARRVALKFLTSESDAFEREKILGEARATAAIDHPYVCKIFETGEYEGKPFIAMEFVEGITLAKRLISGPIPFQEALTMTLEIAEALAEAHGKGMIHCDLKPLNIILTRSGHVKLMDFGLARPIRRVRVQSEDSTISTWDGSVGGTLAYMAPEQARGETLDARADVFSLGIVFFEMLSGVHPFKRNSPETTIAAILHEAPANIEQYLSAASLSLRLILDRALARNPAERYASASELAADLLDLRGNVNLKGAAAPSPAIAILPFKDLSPQHDQEYFCDGLAEELIVALGKIEQLHVASRSAAFRYRDTDCSLKEIGQALKVTKILEGSVRKAGERLRVVVNLVDLENGYPIWSERYDRQLDDIFEIQDNISRSIAEKLRITLTLPPSDKLTPTAPHNVRAYEFYLKGRYFWNKRTEENLRLSIDQFQQALAADPAYAPAYAGLADAWVTLSLYGAARPIDVMPLARHAVDRALDLKPNLPEALATRACIRAIFDWDWNAAEREFETAIRLNPRAAQARQWFAMNCLAPRGRFTHAAEELKLASELEPLSLAIATSLGVLEFFQRNYDMAIERFRAVLARDETFYPTHYFIGQAYSEKMMHEEAIQALERAVALTQGSSESLAALGYARAAAGQIQESHLILRGLLEREESSYVSPVLIAQVQIGLQEWDLALANLDQALRIRSTDLIWLDVRPAFRKIRSHSRVAEILIEAGLRMRPATTALEIF
jgi:serine/threonine protein kinase